MTPEEQAYAEGEIRKTLTIWHDTRPSRVCPDPVNLTYDDIEWFFGASRRTAPPSDFMRIKRTADLNGWVCQYFDHGVGHDSHMFVHRECGLVVSVFYRSAVAVRAELNGSQMLLGEVLPTLAFTA